MGAGSLVLQGKDQASPEIFGYNLNLVSQFVSGVIELPLKEREVHDKQAFKLICDRFGLELPFDFFNTIEADHVVEIFDVQGKAIFKNLHYFKFSNYSIEEHITNSFFDLFSLPSEIEQEIIGYLTAEFSVKDYSLKRPKIPFHYLKEKYSKNKSIFGMDIKTFQLIKTKETGELFGFANMIKVTEYDLTKN